MMDRRVRGGRLARLLVPNCLLGVLCLLALGSPAARAEDEAPGTVQAAYDAGAGLAAKGDRASLTKALEVLDARRAEASDSVEFWLLYARVWQGLGKDASGLWDGIVRECQAQAPEAVAFDLARAALAKDAKERGKHIDAALARNGKSVAARAAKGRHLITEGREDDGAALLEEILEEHPGCVAAALGLAQLALDEGFPHEALEVLAAATKRVQDVTLYHLTALCYERQARAPRSEDDSHDEDALLAKALDAAAQALGLDPTEEHITSYDRLLASTGDVATAAKALKEHFARTGHPMLGALLAKSAFEAGDYEGALLGLEAGDKTSLSVAKGLAVSYARLGRAKEALAASDRVLDMDSAGRLFGARTALWLGDAATALKHLGSLADPEALALRAEAHAWAGDAAAVAKLGQKEIRAGSRVGDDFLTFWFQARLMEALGSEAAATVRKKLLAARFAAGAQVLGQSGDYTGDLGEVKTAGWPRRALTYFRSRCGSHFTVSGDWFGPTIEMNGDSEVTVYRSVHGESKCGDDEEGFQLRFNGSKRKSSSPEGWIEFFSDDEGTKLGDFAPAEQAYAVACAAWLDGKQAEAEKACDKALGLEPAFGRVRAYRSLARSLAGDAERRADAKDAATATELWRDDFALRRTVILLRAWAGTEGLGDEITALAEREARMNIRNLAGL
ncbi:MAG: tetratricopeptide repeat protein [Planctomycetota bacterium]|nr:tetratricopeptide repeat protein [Planctomycetota bacterium]